MIASPFLKLEWKAIGIRPFIGGLLIWEALSLERYFKFYFDSDRLFIPESIQEFWSQHPPWITEAFPWLAAHPEWPLGFVFLSGIALLLNFFPRTAASVAFICLWLLQSIQPWLAGGADALLRLLCFWFSLSSAPCRSSSPHATANLGDYGIPLQLAAMYFMGGLLKSDISWTTAPSAVQLVLASPEFARVPFETDSPLIAHLLVGLSRAVRVLELAAPILIFLGMAKRKMRCPIGLLFAGFHLALAGFLKLGLFPWICIAAWVHVGKTEWRRPRLHALSHPRQLVALLGMGVVLLLNADIARTALIGHSPAQVISELGDITGLAQFWNLFTPGPPEDSGLLRVETTEGEDMSERVTARLGLPVQTLDLQTANPHLRKILRHIVNGDSVVLVKRLCELGCAERHSSRFDKDGVRVVHEAKDLRTFQRQTRTLWESNCR